MLPFLKNKNAQVAGLMVKTRDPDEKPQSEDQDDSSAAIESCAQALISAVHAKDVKGVAEAIKDAFDILDSMPQAESDSVEPHSYAAQNKKASQESA